MLFRLFLFISNHNTFQVKTLTDTKHSVLFTSLFYWELDIHRIPNCWLLRPSQIPGRHFRMSAEVVLMVKRKSSMGSACMVVAVVPYQIPMECHCNIQHFHMIPGWMVHVATQLQPHLEFHDRIDMDSLDRWVFGDSTWIYTYYIYIQIMTKRAGNKSTCLGPVFHYL